MDQVLEARHPTSRLRSSPPGRTRSSDRDADPGEEECCLPGGSVTSLPFSDRSDPIRWSSATTHRGGEPIRPVLAARGRHFTHHRLALQLCSGAGRWVPPGASSSRSGQPPPQICTRTLPLRGLRTLEFHMTLGPPAKTARWRSPHFAEPHVDWIARMSPGSSGFGWNPSKVAQPAASEVDPPPSIAQAYNRRSITGGRSVAADLLLLQANAVRTSPHSEPRTDRGIGTLPRNPNGVAAPTTSYTPPDIGRSLAVGLGGSPKRDLVVAPFSWKSA